MSADPAPPTKAALWLRQSGLRLWQIGFAGLAPGMAWYWKSQVEELLQGPKGIWLLVVETGAILWLSSWLLTLLWQSRLLLRFGLLWDIRANPYCPRCRVPLTNFGLRNFPDLSTRDGGDCAECGKSYKLQDDSRHGYELPELRRRL